MRRGVAAFVALAAAAALGAGCKQRKLTPYERGRLVYNTTCVECHNRDPNLAGVKGPPIAGSSRELIAARILNLSYPPGYKPKRTTHEMRKLPNLKPDIDNLAVFLQASAKKEDGGGPDGAKR
jgi:mono/diheme cytochrome c family protein